MIISVSLCNSSTGKNNTKEQQKIQSSKADSLSDSENNKYNVIKHKDFNGKFPYDLDNPDKKYTLPKYLKEISGLAYYKNDKILCVQDEKADIYIFNLDSGNIVSEYNFGKTGDYEDIALVGQTAYVIRSDGHIFEVESFNSNDRKIKEYKTSLSKKNDTEGIMYDGFSNSLFITCKGYPAVEKDNPYEGNKAIYRFDLKEMKLDKEPNILIDLNRLDSYRKYGMFKEFSLWIAKSLHLIESQTIFHPSGIAIHPLHDELYLISNIGKILIILDRHGKVLHVRDLNIKIFHQPEGICFSPSGDMFIANEGKGGKGYILKFILQKDE